MEPRYPHDERRHGRDRGRPPETAFATPPPAAPRRGERSRGEARTEPSLPQFPGGERRRTARWYATVSLLLVGALAGSALLSYLVVARLATPSGSLLVPTPVPLVPRSATPLPTAPPAPTPTPVPTPDPFVNPNIYIVADDQYHIAFGYPKDWSPQVVITVPKPLYGFSTPTLPISFAVVMDDQPRAATIDNYLADDARNVLRTHLPSQRGPHFGEHTTLGGEDARVADFIAPNGTTMEYQYYILALRDNRVWVLLFVTPLDRADDARAPIEMVRNTFTFCPQSGCTQITTAPLIKNV